MPHDVVSRRPAFPSGLEDDGDGGRLPSTVYVSAVYGVEPGPWWTPVSYPRRRLACRVRRPRTDGPALRERLLPSNDLHPTALRAAPAATTEADPAEVGPVRTSYAPDRDGDPDPGEIVWTWVPFEENDGRGKDRPVLVVAREAAGTLLAVQLSSKRHDRRPRVGADRRSGRGTARAASPGWTSTGCCGCTRTACAVRRARWTGCVSTWSCTGCGSATAGADRGWNGRRRPAEGLERRAPAVRSSTPKTTCSKWPANRPPAGEQGLEGARDLRGVVAEDPAAPGAEHQPPVAVRGGRLQDPLGPDGEGGRDSARPFRGAAARSRPAFGRGRGQEADGVRLVEQPAAVVAEDRDAG